MSLFILFWRLTLVPLVELDLDVSDVAGDVAGEVVVARAAAVVAEVVLLTPGLRRGR